jgi:hypothetical protein
MSFKGNEGSPISRETAKSWINNYEQSEIAREPNEKVVKAHFFGKEKLQKLLNKEGCVGVRVYYGQDNNGNQKLFMVGVKSNMDNLLPTDIKSTSEESDFILDDSWDCPPYCPNSNI